MYAILRFLFPDKPYTAGNSWLLLAARIIFGGLLMSHGIAKWQNFDALSAAFPDPLGVGSGVSLALAIFGVLVLALGAVTRQDVLDLPKGEKIARMLHLH